MNNAPVPDVTARRSIDVAVGILVGLRRCSEDEAFREMVRVVHQTGVPLGDTARALISLAHADDTCVPHRAEASKTWRATVDFPADGKRD